MSLFQLLKTGGWVMFPLLFCSVVVWAVTVERFLSLRQWKEKNRDFLLSFTNLWLRGEKDAARKLSESADVDLAFLARELFQNNHISTRYERRRMEIASEFKKFLWMLGTIGSASPFIGLFGTVVGIIKAFQSMAETGTGGFTVVAGGISEALVATAAGILVAVVAVFLYNYFQVRVSKIQFQFRLLSEELYEAWNKNLGSGD